MKLPVALMLTVALIIPTQAMARAALCKDFKDQKEAQQYHDARKHGWKRLDRDKDGEACECLKGGSSEDDNRCIKWRKKHGK